MRLSLSSDKQGSIRQSQRWSWLEISLLIMLSAAILRLGSDLASQWRLTAERIGLVEANLHARSSADYSADPFGIYIPALDPAIIIDLLGKIPAIGDLPFGLPGGISDPPSEPGNQAPGLTATLLPTQTPTRHASDPTATLPAVISPTATLPPSATPGSQASATPTQVAIVNQDANPNPGTGGRAHSNSYPHYFPFCNTIQNHRTAYNGGASTNDCCTDDSCSDDCCPFSDHRCSNNGRSCADNCDSPEQDPHAFCHP